MSLLWAHVAQAQSEFLNTADYFQKPKGNNPAAAYQAVNFYHPTVTRSVPISTITPTQDEVHKKGVEEYADGDHAPVRLYQGRHRTVWDGHHRIVAAVMRGDTHINAEIYKNPWGKG